jgi:hypothetical protein
MFLVDPDMYYCEPLRDVKFTTNIYHHFTDERNRENLNSMKQNPS